MTPEDLLKELRDIHLPEVIPVSSSSGLSLIPFAVLIVILLVILLIRYRRSRVWLQQARRRLAELNRELEKGNTDANQANAMALLELASKIAPFRQVTPLPRAAFQPLKQIESDDLKLLQKHLHRVLNP